MGGERGPAEVGASALWDTVEETQLGSYLEICLLVPGPWCISLYPLSLLGG